MESKSQFLWLLSLYLTDVWNKPSEHIDIVNQYPFVARTRVHYHNDLLYMADLRTKSRLNELNRWLSLPKCRYSVSVWADSWKHTSSNAINVFITQCKRKYKMNIVFSQYNFTPFSRFDNGQYRSCLLPIGFFFLFFTFAGSERMRTTILRLYTDVYWIKIDERTVNEKEKNQYIRFQNTWGRRKNKYNHRKIEKRKKTWTR